MTLGQIRQIFDARLILASLISAAIVGAFSMYAMGKVLEAEIANIKADMASAELRHLRESELHNQLQESRLLHDEKRLDEHIQEDLRAAQQRGGR